MRLSLKLSFCGPLIVCGLLLQIPLSLKADPPFGKVDQTFAAPVFTARCFPSYCFSDQRGGVLWSWINELPFDLIGANNIRVGGLVRTTSQGSVDPSFVVGPALQGTTAIAVQPDGRILVGGDQVNDVTADGVPNYRIFRLMTNGVLDATYQSPVLYAPPRGMTLQKDGKLIVAPFDPIDSNGGLAGIVRLNTNGTQDTTFNSPTLTGLSPYTFGLPVIDTNGMIYVTGGFTQVNGVARVGLARLFPNGTLDSSFVPSGFGFSSLWVRGVLIQPDGKVIIAGRLTVNSDPTHTYYPLLRLNTNGTLDTSFTLVSCASINFYRANKIMWTPAGKILAIDTSMVRFNNDGGLDNSFTSLPFDFDDYWFDQLPDGRIVIASDPAAGATLINNQPLNGSACLLPGGTMDPSFSPPIFQNQIFPTTVVQEDDGRLLIAGSFDHAGTNGIAGLARLGFSGGQLDSNYTLPISNVISVLALASVPTNQSYALVEVGNVNYGLITNLFYRLKSDGSMDASFAVDETALNTNGNIFTDLLMQGGNPILSSGQSAEAVLGYTNVPMIRFLSSGEPDPTFKPNIPPPGFANDYNGNLITDWTGFPIYNVGVVFPGDVQWLTILTNGQLLGAEAKPDVTGAYNGYQLIRLNADGTQDRSFNGATFGPVAQIYTQPVLYDDQGEASQCLVANPIRCITSAIVQSNGMVLVAGSFTNVNGAPSQGIVRLRPDLSIDPTFPVGTGPLTGSPRHTALSGLSQDTSGKLWVTGNFTQWDGVGASGYVRLNSDGSVDTKCIAQSSHYPLEDDGFVTSWIFSGLLPGGAQQAFAFGPHLVPGDNWPRSLSRLAPYPPPKLNASGISTNLGFSVTLTTVPGWTYKLQTSTDLVHWQDWQSFTGAGGQQTFSDSQLSGLPEKFYRIIYQ